MTPEEAAALQGIQGYASGQAPATPIDARSKAALAAIDAFATRSTPPAPAPPPTPAPSPPAGNPLAYHRNPSVAVAPNGRVVDPATGKPFPPRGQADPNAQPGMLAGMLEGASPVIDNPDVQAASTAILQTTSQVQRKLNPALRVLAAIANPVQQTVAEGAKGYKQGGVAGIIPGIEAGSGRIAHSIIQPGIARADIGTNAGVQDPLLRGILDFGGNTAIDYATGKFIQAPLVEGLGSAAGSALGKAGAYDVPIPGIGKSVNELTAAAQDVNKVHQYFGAAAGRAGEIQREAQGFLQRAQQRTDLLKKTGVNIEGIGEGSGQKVNALDEFVSHYIEAGSGPRAKFGNQQDVLNEAAKLGSTSLQQGLIKNYVTETAKDYTTSWNRVGRALEGVGFLKPGTVNKLGASYFPGMYHAAAGNPGDIEAWLDAANQIGGVNPKAVGMAENLLANEQRGFANAGKARTLETYQQRVEHGGEFQASPVFARSVKTGSNVAAKGEAMADIAADPSLVAQTYSRGKLQLSGRQYGQAQGLYVQPRTKAAIDALLTPDIKAGPLDSLMRFWRNSTVAGSLPMVVHHSKYTMAIAEGRLAEEGVAGLTPADLARAAAQRQAYVVGGKASPAVDALSKNTRAFVPQTGLLNEMSSSLRSGLGIKGGAGQSVGLGAEQLANQTRKVIGSVEQTTKIAMTEKLAAKYGYQKAAQIAQEAVGGTGPPGQALTNIERMGILPFATAKVRALPKVSKIAVTRPDILLRYSGVNEAHALGNAMGPQVQARQQMAENPDTAIPVPGMKDRYGRQLFLPESPLALNPVNDLPRAAGVGFLGPAGRLMLAAGNAKRDSQGNIVPLSEPGELPPWEKVLRQVEYATGGGGTIGRNVQRLQAAAKGEVPGGMGAKSGLGGALQEPETVGQAVLGIALGASLKAPESPQEGLQRATANANRAKPWQQYAANYQRMVESGAIKVDRSPALDKITRASDAAGQMKHAYQRLQALTSGQEGSYGGNDRAARIRNQVNWFTSLESRFKELQGRDLTLEDLATVQ